MMKCMLVFPIFPACFATIIAANFPFNYYQATNFHLRDSPLKTTLEEEKEKEQKKKEKEWTK